MSIKNASSKGRIKYSVRSTSVANDSAGPPRKIIGPNVRETDKLSKLTTHKAVKFGTKGTFVY